MTVPLTTFTGLSGEAIRSLARGRDVFIWGVGPLGRDVCVSLTGNGVNPKAFLDSRKYPDRNTFRGLPVTDPKTVVNRHFDSGKSMVVIASSGYRKEAEAWCRQHGLKPGDGYITYLSVSRPVAVVEIAGLSGIRSRSGGASDAREDLPEGLMSLGSYKRVLAKLTMDIPCLSRVELPEWGEPFLNPDLPDIIEWTERILPCSVLTRLMEVSRLDRVLESGPSELIVVVDGCGASCNVMRGAASWEKLLGNLRRLGAATTRGGDKIRVEVRVHSLKDDSMEDRNRLVALCRELDLPVEFCDLYPSSYEDILSYIENRSLGVSARYTIEHLPWDLDHALALARRDVDRPCLPQTVFPVVYWDLGVALCHVFCRPVIAGNYLDIDWNELLSLRHSADHCHVCQRHALHRLDLNVLRRRYPQEAAQLYGKKQDAHE